MTDAVFTELKKQCVKSLLSVTDNVLQYLDENKDQQLNELRNYLKDYCLLEEQQNIEDQVLNEIQNDFDRSNIDSFEQIVQSKLTQLSQVDVCNHPDMIEFGNKIHQQSQNPISSIQATASRFDPITKRPIRHPVKNSACIHIYERESIIQHMRNRENAHCPVSGCTKRLEKIIDVTSTNGESSQRSMREPVVMMDDDDDE